MSAQLRAGTTYLPLSITQSVLLRDGRTTDVERAEFGFDTHTWGDATRRLASSLAPHATCLYSLERLEHGNALTREHVIPQATGTRWIYLPAGLTSDAVNSAMSAHETELFRKGMLAALLTWYVQGKRSINFVDGDVSVEFRNDPVTGFQIKATTPNRDPFFLVQNHEGNPRTLRFPVMVEEANPRSVSLVVHKIAYLTLCVAAPSLALSPLFNDARDYLCERKLGAFRPYAEKFLPGASPGFRVDWLLNAEESGPRSCKLRSVGASVRIHHVAYTFTLGGSALGLPQGPNIKTFSTPSVPPRQRRTITWTFDQAEELDARATR